MLRQVTRRIVSPTGGWSSHAPGQLFDLRWAAWGAAVETLQIDLVASGWMNLFSALLEPHPSVELRWLGGGPGSNAEVKRAYSALFGRFFGRAVLRRDHGCRWLRQVQDGMELAPGLFLQRRAGFPGDLPDWVGWDDHHDRLVVAEAKGSHDRGKWNGMMPPPPIRTALDQLERVEIVDATGPIHFKTWAVACRWGTVANGVTPTVVTCDPDRRGRMLEPSEARKLRAEMRARWFADLLEGVGRRDIAAMARGGDMNLTDDPTGRELTLIPGRSGYGALAIEAGGVVPLTGVDRAGRSRVLLDMAGELGRETALVLVDRSAAEGAIMRQDADGIDTEAAPETGVDLPSLDEITVDGVTFRTSVEDIGFADDQIEI
jgi:hypothetical protein